MSEISQSVLDGLIGRGELRLVAQGPRNVVGRHVKATGVIDSETAALDAIRAAEAPRVKRLSKAQATKQRDRDHEIIARQARGVVPYHVAAAINSEAIPATVGACADALYTLREQRLIVQKEADALEEREKAIKQHLIDTLPKSDQTGAVGHVARAQIKTKRVPQVDDWEALYKHVRKTGDFEILQRRLAADAIAERWEAGKKVPGVGAFNAVTVSVTKL